MGKTILGLDLGSNSLGWALLSADGSGQPSGIIDAGVRIFPKAVEDKTPTPKNQKRRESRLARRTIQRRSRRKSRLLNYLIKLNLLPAELHGNPQPEGILNGLGDPYQLRARALDHDLTPHELGRVLLHFAQRRGFLSNKKTLLGRDMLDDPDVIAVLGEEEGQSDSDGSEESAFKADISLLRAEIKDGGFRTLGEFLASKPVHECKRNRHDEHIRTDRRMYMDELGLIFARQSSCHPILTEEVQGEIEDIVFFQRPLKLKKDRVGRCSLEPSKKRSAIARLEYQRFRYLQDINNLQYFCQNSDQWVRLNEADREKLGALFEVSDGLTFARIGKELGLQRGTSFNLDSGVKKLKGNTTSAAIRAALPEWDELASEVQFSLVEDLISIKKKSALKRRLMRHWGFTGKVALGLCLVELEPEHGQVSLKAIGKLMPHLVAGMVFSDARQAAGYGYEVAEIVAKDKLGRPPEIPNPIVSKGLSELRRVVNAIIAEHGRPDTIRIEMARDLEMNTTKYKKFVSQQAKNTKVNDRAIEAFRDAQSSPTGSRYPSRDQKIKYRLWLDQGHCCAYSGRSINLATLFTAEIEVDHIVPYSRSLNDSYMNKVVCFAKENQVKGQRTPKDAFGADEERWNQITQALGRLPRELSSKRDAFYKTEADLSEHDFIGSQLTDTRYMSKVAGEYLKTLGSEITFTRGIMTSWLRRQWRLNDLIGSTAEKERSDHRHHAIDAVVTACIDRQMYKSLVDISRDLERGQSGLTMDDVYIDPPISTIREELDGHLGGMIVSHVPQRKISGALHEDTGVGFVNNVGTVYRKRLDENFDAKGALKIIDPVVRSRVLEHLAKHNGKAKEAFAPGFKLTHVDGQTLIKRVRVVQAKTTKEALEKGKFGVMNSSGNVFKWHAYGNLHHVEVLRSQSTGKIQSVFVTAAEAAARARGVGRPAAAVITSDWGDEYELLFALHINELVQVTIKGECKVYRIQKLEQSGGVLNLRCHTAGNIKNKDQLIRKSLNSLIKDFELRPLIINVLGKLVND